ncbi:TetR/AcrR family transcriptional regulator [Rhizobium calliandrae]|uniref:TetR/AcrR family transcriptional regulator n=1 Tax=Rhizobium calliandrae TaxID=1312182 RepID=A0ABT7KN09_9HYPH|nr:TetR/AcrR family transcriptional regulator [Rhizobium calliandrae]MDL2410005.1 TetR/AcrR family transcriptional regulator [Rhizobium calliandrae]
MSERIESSSAVKTKAAGRRRRADAQRNIGSLIQTASEVFAEAGMDVPIREIADRAGVGVGTLYRHFPTRSDLVVAVFRREVDEAVEAAKILAAQHPPGEALERWVAHYVDFIAAHRGLAAAFNSGDPALEGLPAHFQERLGPLVQNLLDAAAANGDTRPGVPANELLHGIGMLCVPPMCGEPTDPQRMVGLFMDGLRYRSDKAVE